MNYTDVFGAQTVPPSEESYASYSITGTANQFYWPEQYGGSGYLLADITELTGTAGAAIRLPVADAVSVGESFLLRNLGSNTIQVNNSAGAPAASLPAGQTLFCYVIDNTTPAGQWQIFTFGAGTSAADAVALAGDGLSVAAGRLRVSSEYRAINFDYPIVPENRGQILDVVTGTVTVTTPDATTAGDGFYCFIRNSSAGNLTLEGRDTQTVNGALSVTFAPGDSVILMSTGTNWVTVGYGRSVSGQFSEVIVNAAAGDVALSSSDVAGRMIRVAGTATTSITVTLPAIDNIYFVVVEAGMGVHGANFTAGGGGAVTVLTANQRTVLTSDGTNVLAAVTTTVTSSLALVDGSAAAPSISFSLDSDTGFYRSGPGAISFTSNGEKKLKFGPTGLESGVLAERVDFVPVDGLAETNVQGAIEALQLLTVKTSDVIAIAKGGTGATTAAGARTALLPSYNGNANKALVVNAGATDVTYAVVGDVSSAGVQDLSNKTLLTTKEKVSVSSAAAAGTVNLDAATASILYYQSAAGGNWTLNVRGNSGTTLSSLMAVGTATTVVFMNTNGGTAYRLTSLEVDSVTITPRWQGGTAPSTGNANSIDAYVITIIKTSESAFTALASLTRFA